MRIGYLKKKHEMFKKLTPKNNVNSSDPINDQQKLKETYTATQIQKENLVLEDSPNFQVTRLQKIVNPPRPPVQPLKSHSEKRSVLIGPGVEFDGSIGRCDEVVIEGTVKADITTAHLIVKASGKFSGTATVDAAEIEGQYTGTLTANSQLQILKTGNVAGDINYARLEVLTGGILSGNVDVFSEGKEKENAKP